MQSLKELNRSAVVPAQSWYTLAILMAIYAMHAVDRSVMSVLMEPIKQEFGLSDSQTGALNGLTHGIAYALGVVPISLLGDRARRKRLIAILVAAWSSLTVACGLAPSSAWLAASRAGVGLAEAGFSPIALSMVGDLFPARLRGTAVGLFYAATAIGTGLMFVIGAFFAAQYGWRTAFVIAGLPGLLLALVVVLSVTEPRRGTFDIDAGVSARPGLRATLSSIRKDRAITDGIAGTVLGTMSVAAVFAWGVSFFGRHHALPLHEAGPIMAVVAGLMMGIASASAGPLNDRLRARYPDRLTMMPAAALLLTAPVGLLALSSSNVTGAILGLCLFGFLHGAWLAQGFGTVMQATAPTLRSGVMGVTQLFSNLIGTGLGPLAAGLLSDALGDAGGSLRTGLMIMVMTALPGAALLWRAGVGRQS